MGGSGKQAILLVEDYNDSREMTRLLLEGLNYRILEARNGKEALDIASTETPDLVVTDFNLPDIDGTTLIKRLRKLGDKLSRIPIIMLTAYDGEETSRMAMAAGCTAFLTKPMNFVVLEKTIDRLLEESKELNGPINDISQSATGEGS